VSAKKKTARPAPTTVLIVDDDDDGRTISIELLELHGFRATGARDGQDAIRQLAAAAPDVMVLDLMMPTVSGADVLKVVDPGVTRVVVYTGVSERRRLVSVASHVAVSTVLLKPADLDEFVAAVRRAAEQRRA
jgi:DNA-binding NtrC family response regulator